MIVFTLKKTLDSFGMFVSLSFLINSKKDTSIILVEKDKLTLSEMKIATTFSSGVL